MTTPSTGAAERTALAWHRTALTALGTAATFLTHLIIDGWGAGSVIPTVAAVALLCLTAVASSRNRSLQQGNWSNAAAVTGATAIVLTVALAAMGIEIWEIYR